MMQQPLTTLLSKITRRRIDPVIRVERKQDDVANLIGARMDVAIGYTLHTTVTATGIILGYAVDTEDDNMAWFFLREEGTGETGWFHEFQVIRIYTD